jgi:gluconate 2-dehydrogenase gamma chain
MSNASSARSAPLDGALLALLRAVVERLIPSDDRGPGAREAEAARYICTALGAEYRHYLADYQAGLAAIDARALANHGAPFVALDQARQDEVLADIERGQAATDGPAPRTFFDLILKHTREGVFGDPRWGGNADRVGWTMIGYGGPRLSWPADDQRVEFVRDG